MRDYLRRVAYQTIAADELLQRGWLLWNYRPPTREIEVVGSWACGWNGVARHPQAVGVILCICTSQFDVDHVASHIPHDEAVLPFVCPAFQANPKGKSWHIEKNGIIIASGRFPSICDDGMQEQRREAMAQVIDKIEQVALGIRTIAPAAPKVKYADVRKLLEQILGRKPNRITAQTDGFFTTWETANSETDAQCRLAILRESDKLCNVDGYYHPSKQRLYFWFTLHG